MHRRQPNSLRPNPSVEVGVNADVIRCGACGGPVDLTDIRCRSCGSQVATVACPNCLGLVSIHARHCEQCGAAIVPAASRNETPSDLGCPSCKGVKLTKTQLGDMEVDQCFHCGGVWLRQDLFDQVCGEKEVRGRALGALPIASGPKVNGTGPVRYRPCPVCARMMNRYNYARISGVIIDGCKNDGLWFDKDELRQVLEFIQGGGLDKSHDREVARLDQEQRTKAQMARLDLGMHPSSYGEYSTLGGQKLGDGFLSNLVDGLLDHFIV